MIGPKLVATSIKHAWAAAALVATILVVAACELPGAERTATPATPTPAASPAGTRLPPATVTAAATTPRPPTPTARAAVTLSPVTSPEARRLTHAATPSAGEEATARAVATVARATARAQATVEAWPTWHAARVATARAQATPTISRVVHIARRTPCVTGIGLIRQNASWTADGSHILFAYNSEVWAVKPDESRLWRVAPAWEEEHPEAGNIPYGWKTSFDVTRDGKHVVYATCRYPPDRPRSEIEELGPFALDYELAVVGLDGRAGRRLTRQRATDHSPAWSPDGTRVAFVSNRPVTEAEKRPGRWPPPALYTMAADGTDVRRLATGGASVAWQRPAWSPDGRFIAVNGWRQEDAESGLYVVPADGTGFVRLADAVSGGSWSPDGTRLAFAQPDRATVALYTIAADGSDVRARRVTTVRGWEPSSRVPDPSNAWIDTIAWSPDGSKLLYACGEGQFCVVTLDGQRLGTPCQGWADGPACYSRDGRQLTGTSLVGEHAVWSPDGARIAVTTPGARGRRHGNDFLGPYPIILYSAAPDGSDVKPLALGREESVSRVRSLIAAQAADEDLATSRAACTAGYVVSAPDANPGLVRDCETLLAAREALFYGVLVNWGSGSPLDQWEGVTVTGSPLRVTGLALVNERLRGAIPPALEQLTSLKQLYLARNEFTGCIPVGLKRVPDSDLAELGLPDCEAGS